MRLNLNRYRKELTAIKLAQASKDFTPVLFIELDTAGNILIQGKGRPFENLFEVEARLVTMAGITKQTKIFVEDFGLMSDGYYDADRTYHNGLYLSTEPILYYCNAAERKRFMEWSQQNRYTDWLEFYLALINSLLADSISHPTIGENVHLMADQDIALKDLIENRNRFSPAELVLRYQDRKWGH